MKIQCDKCNYLIHEDAVATAREYNKDIKLLFDASGKAALDDFPDYTVFRCYNCGTIRKIKLSELLLFKNQLLFQLLLNIRTESCVKISDSFIYNEDRGIDYCGVCQGFIDGDGYCYKDIISECQLRRDTLGY